VTIVECSVLVDSNCITALSTVASVFTTLDVSVLDVWLKDDRRRDSAVKFNNAEHNFAGAA
jgi:hypothetical protein